MIATAFDAVRAGRPIGVFDSGVGGLSILRALRAELPHEHFVYFADSGHAPYGERDEAHVIARSRAITAQLRAEHGIKALVIACNTATAAAVHLLRAEHPDLPIIGVEPALKPAVGLTRTGRIGVLATRGTLGSAKFAALLASLSGLAEFTVQPCDGLADAIERQEAAKIIALCGQYTLGIGRFGLKPGQIDTLVLGCTHYPFANEYLRALLGPAIQFIDTGEPVARHTRQLLMTSHIPLQNADAPAVSCKPTGHLTLVSSGAPAALKAAAQRWLGLAVPVHTTH
ncbi:MAG: glutamate racemase [Burkholderiaceae bacterium]